MSFGIFSRDRLDRWRDIPPSNDIYQYDPHTWGSKDLQKNVFLGGLLWCGLSFGGSVGKIALKQNTYSKMKATMLLLVALFSVALSDTILPLFAFNSENSLDAAVEAALASVYSSGKVKFPLSFFSCSPSYSSSHLLENTDNIHSSQQPTPPTWESAPAVPKPVSYIVCHFLFLFFLRMKVIEFDCSTTAKFPKRKSGSDLDKALTRGSLPIYFPEGMNSFHILFFEK